MNKRLFNVLAIVAMLAIAFSVVGTAWAASGGNGGSNSDSPNTGPFVDTTSALVQLKGAPLSTDAQTRPPQGKKINFNSNTVKSYRALLSAERNSFRQWLQANAPKAQITGQFDISLNAVSVQLNGTPLTALATAPMVQRVEYEGLYYPTQFSAPNDPDLNLISAFAAWDQSSTPANAGEGVKVAIVDTGIDITHPCFSDTGYPPQQQLGDTSFTNNKVIVARVFNMKTPSQHYTPEALQAHGTHVAGTVACNFDTPANVDGVPIPHGISGVAPRALLGNYNIFPGDVLNARSEDILNALEAAYTDGMDVANMSLGGNASGIQDLLSIGVNNLDEANMVVVVAAGNSSPGHYTIESPGSAARALTAGAATVGHFIGNPVTVGGSTFASVVGDFGKVASDITAPLNVLTGSGPNGLNLACSAISTNLAGQIALLTRGTCSFSTKLRNAQTAGAVAVIVANSQAGDPIVMGQDGTPNQPTLPGVMVSFTDGGALKAFNGQSTTISASQSYLVTGNNDFMASFSSEGPTDVDFRVKPDVVAPGVNVLSSIPHQFCGTPPCFAFFQGTSMATPHLAGSAAVVLWLHPTWSAAEVRSAIVNTADQGVLKMFTSTTPETDVNIIGAGRENLLSAVKATVALDPVSISFGSVPFGSGQTRTFSLGVTNISSSSKTFTFAITSTTSTGVTFSVTHTLSLGAGKSGSVTLTMSAVKGAAPGDHQALLSVWTGGSEVAHAVVYTFVKQ